MVKSGLEKIFLKFLHVGDYFPLLHKSAQNHKFSNKNNYLAAWRDFKIKFSRPLFTIIFRPKMVISETYLFHFGQGSQLSPYCKVNSEPRILGPHPMQLVQSLQQLCHGYIGVSKVQIYIIKNAKLFKCHIDPTGWQTQQL